jgi:hypothetical protein
MARLKRDRIEGAEEKIAEEITMDERPTPPAALYRGVTFLKLL